MNDFCRLVAPALEAYAAATGLGAPELDDAVVADLLADLHHWCDHLDWNWTELTRRADSHYAAER